MKKWIILTISIIAVLILCILIWFVFPIIAFSGVEPFANLWLRLALIILLLACYFGYLAYKIYQHRQSAKEFAENVTVQEPDDDNSDSGVLAEKMQDALLTLRGSQRTQGDFLYELPWYLIVGPPGAGKTTAILNCGLKFPLAAHAAGPIAGSGGTRYCDWWFTEEAVFIDTAGRYTTQDSDTELDRKSWLSFLDLLKKHRTRQPINGVMVAISIGDLLTMKPDELARHAIAIRKRLSELNHRLLVDFPVYVIFTKADLIAGFMEFFGQIDEEKRKAVWGATFQTSNKKENRVGDVGPELDLLISRLLAELPDRLQDEPDPVSRVRLTGLPSQLINLKPTITQFLNQIFEPTRYQTSAALRGFYLTSGTQEGTPIDRVLGSLSRSLGLQSSVSAAYSGKAKSYFLEHLLTKVVFGEAGWVSTNAAAVRRRFLLRAAGYSLVGILTVVALSGWLMSYFFNSTVINATDTASDAYNKSFATIVNEDTINDTDFAKILPPLEALRSLPTGINNADQTQPLISTLGLSQHNRLTNYAAATYRIGLDRLLRPRLILHLEKRIAGMLDRPESLYEPLKAYLMLGGDPNIPVDNGLITDIMKDEWAALYPKEPNRQLREQLNLHLQSLLELDAGIGRPIALNGDVIKAAQDSLARLPVAERAFALLKSNARSDEIKDWSVVNRSGPDADQVFTTNDGSPLESVGIPAFFTYQGFYKLFFDKMKSVTTQLNTERWVLGEAGGTDSLNKQFDTLGLDLFRIYDREFIKTWSAALRRLKLRRFAAGKPDYAALRAATGATSPIRMLLQSISDETKLTEARDTPGGTAAEIAKKAAEKLLPRTSAQLDNLKQIGIDPTKKSEGRGGEVEAAFVPGAIIQDRFRRYHELAAKQGDKSQIDLLIEQLKGLYQSLLQEEKFEQAAQARQAMQGFVSSLSTSSSRLEEPFAGMFKAAIGEFETKIVGDAVGQLKNQLTGSVTRKCNDIIGNRYPFSPTSQTDVPIAEFGRLFGSNGIFDAFFKQNLVGLVDTSGPQWVWKQDSKLSQQLSSDTLLQFQKAARIRDTFFNGKGSAPNVKFAMLAQSMSQQTPSARVEVNGVQFESPFGVESRADFEWPGNSPDGTASIEMPEGDGSQSAIKFTGPWAIHRLLNAGAMRLQGGKAIVRFVIKGRDVTYQLTFDTIDNPFTLISQVKFACPSDL